MARTLYLHIGSHKTGTTSIQGFLARNAEALAARGYFYPVGSNKLNLGGVTGGIDEEEADELADTGLSTKLHNAIQLMKSGDAPHVIASSEGFSYLNDPAEIRALGRRLRRSFARVQVICYLRRQDQFAVSHHQEGANPQEKPAAKLHGHRPTALPETSALQGKYLDYATRLGHWGDAFGDRNVTIRVYERALLKNGDSVADFLDIVGLGDLDAATAATRNTSMGFARTKIGHMLHGVVADQAVRAAILARLPDEGKLLPARQAAQDFLEPYLEGNAALNKRFRINKRGNLFSDDFSMYPEEGDELWTEDRANVALRACMEMVQELAGKTFVFERADYEKASAALAETDPDMAARFLEAARGLKPGSEKLRLQAERQEKRRQEATAEVARKVRPGKKRGAGKAKGAGGEAGPRAGRKRAARAAKGAEA